MVLQEIHLHFQQPKAFDFQTVSFSAEDESYDYPYEPSLHIQHKFQQQQNLSNPPSLSSNNLYDQADPQAMKGQLSFKSFKSFRIVLLQNISFALCNGYLIILKEFQNELM